MKEPITHPLKWLRIVPGYYARYRYTASVEELGLIFSELLDCVLEDKEPTIAVNILNMEKSHQAWGKHIEKKEEAAKSKERPTLEEALAYAAENGLEHAEEWYNVSVARGWRDMKGKYIRSWQAALRGFSNKFNQNLYTQPETAQQQENEE
ncbi:MAG: hypothetical protein FWF63_00680 [Fibromonadales bacterium]|nr:hypothetical protein [Fibromonadales bacterium]